MKQLLLSTLLILSFLHPQLTNSQQEICKAVKTVRIVVEQNYGAAGNISLPIANEAKTIISKYTDLKVINVDSIKADALLKINILGTALSNEYGTSMTGPGPRVEHFSGARLDGDFTYKIAGVEYYRGSVDGKYPPPREIDRKYPSPSYAPFNKVLDKLDLKAELIKMLGAIYGAEPVIHALEDTNQGVRLAAIQTCVILKDPIVVEPLIAAINHDDILYANIIRALGDIKDPRAVPAIISELNNATWSAANALGKINDKRAIKPLIDQLAKPHNSTLRKEVIKALKIITGKNYGKNHKKWLAWWNENY